MVQLEGILTEDGQLVVQIPKNLAPGRVKITIDPIDAVEADPSAALTLEEMRQRLKAAGKLGRLLPANPYPLNDVKLPFDLSSDAPGSEVLVDEDRGER